MEKPGVVVVNADRQESLEIVALLTDLAYRPTPLYKLGDLARHLRKNPARVVILDLDTMAADNQFFRTLKKEHPDLVVLSTSSRTYHPELEEALGSHVYACLGKPLDQDELSYWLRSIIDNQSNSG